MAFLDTLRKAIFRKPDVTDAALLAEQVMLKVAMFADAHDLIVPALTIRAYGFEVGLTMQRLPKGSPAPQ